MKPFSRKVTFRFWAPQCANHNFPEETMICSFAHGGGNVNFLKIKQNHIIQFFCGKSPFSFRGPSWESSFPQAECSPSTSVWWIKAKYEWHPSSCPDTSSEQTERSHSKSHFLLVLKMRESLKIWGSIFAPWRHFLAHIRNMRKQKSIVQIKLSRQFQGLRIKFIVYTSNTIGS